MTTTPLFVSPEQPDHTAIVAMHRGHGNHITFHRKDATGKFENLFAIPAKDLPEVFAEFVAPHVESDGYVSVNGYWQPKRSPSQVQPRFPFPARKAKYLQRLTACYLDIDCYAIGVSDGMAIGHIIDKQDQGVIPPASMLTRSGRGVWPLWFLRDDNGGPVQAWPETVETYRRIQQNLWQRFAGISADAGALDATRIMRVPGSMNTKSQTRVAYWFQADASGQPFTYTLDDLAVFLGVKSARLTPHIRVAVDPAYSERGRKGYAALWQKRLQRLLMLISARRVIFEGTRMRTALLLATFMHRARIPLDEIKPALHHFGQYQCSPPLPRYEIKDAIESRVAMSKITDATIAKWLDITSKESAEIGWPSAVEADQPRIESASTQAQREPRRQRLTAILSHAVTYPTLAQLQSHLEEIGLYADKSTIKRDLDALANVGIIRRNPRGRYHDEPTQLLLPMIASAPAA